MFNFLKSSAKKEIYLAGWEVVFDDSDQCAAFLATQGVSRENALRLDYALKATFKNDKLFTVEEFEAGESMGKRELDKYKKQLDKEVQA